MLYTQTYRQTLFTNDLYDNSANVPHSGTQILKQIFNYLQIQVS